MQDQNNLGLLAGALLGGTTLSYAVLRFVWRRTLRDGLEGAKDRAETDFVQTLTAHNASLRQEIQAMATERNTALAHTGKLEAQLDAKTEQLLRAQEEIARLRHQIQHLMYPACNHNDSGGLNEKAP